MMIKRCSYLYAFFRDLNFITQNLKLYSILESVYSNISSSTSPVRIHHH